MSALGKPLSFVKSHADSHGVRVARKAWEIRGNPGLKQIRCLSFAGRVIFSEEARTADLDGKGPGSQAVLDPDVVFAEHKSPHAPGCVGSFCHPEWALGRAGAGWPSPVDHAATSCVFERAVWHAMSAGGTGKSTAARTAAEAASAGGKPGAGFFCPSLGLGQIGDPCCQKWQSDTIIQMRNFQKNIARDSSTLPPSIARHILPPVMPRDSHNDDGSALADKRSEGSPQGPSNPLTCLSDDGSYGEAVRPHLVSQQVRSGMRRAMLCGWKVNAGDCMAFVFDAVIPHREFKLGTVFDPDEECPGRSFANGNEVMCDDDYEEPGLVQLAPIPYP